MHDLVEVLAVVLVALAATPALAHALELPGKLRLSREAYLTVQPIYYPGFTIAGGVGEVGAVVATLVLLFLTPRGGSSFWLTLVALVGLVATHAAYWIFTHPVNRFWLQREELSGLGRGFFSLGTKRADTRPPAWTDLRDRWEYSHVLRAGLASVSFIALIIAVA
jgi:hypothetical protein